MPDSPEISRTYSGISLETFLTERVDKPTEFNWRDPVTRGNFISWLETSFRVSMGQSSAQWVLFMWTSDNLNFNYMASLKNFLKAREESKNWNFLSEEEKKFFASKYLAVRKHHQVAGKYGSDLETLKPEEILDTAKEQIEGILDIRSRGGGPITPMVTHLRGMSPDQFRIGIKDYVAELRAAAPL